MPVGDVRRHFNLIGWRNHYSNSRVGVKGNVRLLGSLSENRRTVTETRRRLIPICDGANEMSCRVDVYQCIHCLRLMRSNTAL